MNIGHDDDPLQPHVESPFNDKEEGRLSKFVFVCFDVANYS